MNRLTLILAFICVSAVSASAQKVVYDADFEYRFDNREFDRGGNTYMNSMTVNALRSRALFGLSFREPRVSHSFMGGVTLLKDMGQGTSVYTEPSPNADTWKLFRDIVLYYRFDYALSRSSKVSGAFGVYPSYFVEEDYSRAFVSDSLKFYDSSYEGMMFSYKSRRARAELCLDWMGLKGMENRERFRVFGGGRYCPLSWLSAGVHFSMYHYAGSKLTPGVVDNILVNPFLLADFSRMTGMQALSLKAGLLAAYQRERKFEDVVYTPAGFEAVLRAQKWGFGLDWTFYAGSDLMTFYNTSLYGHKLGNTLYFGSPFYRSEAFDRVEAYWAPAISKKLSMKISCVFNFAVADIPYQGTQQILSLIYNI